MKRSASSRDPQSPGASGASPEAAGSDPGGDRAALAESRRRLHVAEPTARRESILKSGLKSLLRSVDIYILRMLPRGVDVSHDLRQVVPSQRFELILDVGANVGQSTRRYLRDFPRARIISFEPCGRLFAKLEATFAGMPRVTCERLALSSSEGDATLLRTRDPMMHHLAVGGEDDAPGGVAGVEQVLVTTVDHYCERNGVEHIDFLKIDTEGHDFEVIVGAERMLSEGRVTALQCECSVSPENTFHVGFDAVRSHLEIKGYRLFGIYEQVPEWIRGAP
nr:FkbM family methyltransferase [Gammaproteobacteria bacterium]